MPLNFFSKTSSSSPSPSPPNPPLEPSSSTPTTTTTTQIATIPPPPPPSTSTSNSTTSTTYPLPLRPIALTLLVACPLLAFAPPRKLDFYTFSLACTWSICAQHVYATSSFASSPFHFPFRFRRSPAETRTSREEESRREEKDEGMLRRLWIGEKAGWEKERMEEDRERMEEGLGIGELIKERVREVMFGEEKEEGEEEEEEEDDERGGNREGKGNAEEKRKET